jgi:hypothetical protein
MASGHYKNQEISPIDPGINIERLLLKKENMEKKGQQADRDVSPSKIARSSDTVPFTERPSDARSSDESSSRDKLVAEDLFSLFTADIIKEDKIFTR